MLIWNKQVDNNGVTLTAYSGKLLIATVWMDSHSVKVKSKYFRGRSWYAGDIYVSGVKPLPDEKFMMDFVQSKWDNWKKEADLG